MRLTVLVHSEMSQQIWDELPWNLLQTVVAHRGLILLTLVISQVFLWHHHDVDILEFYWTFIFEYWIFIYLFYWSWQLLDGLLWHLVGTHIHGRMNGWIVKFLIPFIFHLPPSSGQMLIIQYFGLWTVKEMGIEKRFHVVRFIGLVCPRGYQFLFIDAGVFLLLVAHCLRCWNLATSRSHGGEEETVQSASFISVSSLLPFEKEYCNWIKYYFLFILSVIFIFAFQIISSDTENWSGINKEWEW